MSLQLRYCLLLLCLIWKAANVQASHIVGAEISYAPVNGTTSYRVEVVLYRDCAGLPAQATIPVQVSSSCFPSPTTINAQQAGPGVIVPLACTAAATQCNGGAAPGIEKITYVTNVQINGACQDWTFSYTECCRGAATNMANPGAEALYVYAVLKNPAGSSNRSVSLTQLPRFMLLNGQNNIFNNGAVDADGDSVVCTLTDAKPSATASVLYSPGFSGASPLSSQPAMTVDPLSGQVAVTPISVQNGVVAYRFDEYRNGVLVGTTVRDVQVAVTNASNALPSLSGVNGTGAYALQACVGDTVAFSLYSGDSNPSDSVSIEVSNAGAGATATVLHGTYASPSGAVSDSVRIYLVANQSMVGNGPHFIYVTVRDGVCPTEGVRTYVIDLAVQSCGSGSNCSFSYSAAPSNPMLYSFIASPSGSGNPISWTFGDGSTATGPSVSHLYSSQGVFVACMNEIDNNGAISCSQCVSFIVDSAGSCGVNAVNLQNHQYLFQVANQSANLTATWSFGDGQTGIGSSVNHTYAASGTYTVCVTLTDATGTQICANCITVYDTVSGNCAITGSVTITAPYTTTLSVPIDPMASSYVWDMGDGGTASGPVITYTYANPGVYTVCVNVLGQGMVLCQSCTTLVFNAPPSCSAAFVAVNNGMSAFFIDQSAGASSAATYQWDFGDQSTSTARFPQHTYLLPGTYAVCLTLTDGNCSSVFCDSVLVDTLINVNPACQAGFVTVQTAPYQLAVVNLSSGLNIAFSWDFGDGTTSTSPYPSHVYASTGSYVLCLTVSDATGCSDTFCDTISVDSSGNMVRSSSPFSINVISPSMLSGVEDEPGLTRFSCYPNPVHDRLTVVRESAADRMAVYRIIDMQGRELQRGEMNASRSSIEMNGLASGTYLLELLESERYPAHVWVIKQ